MVQAAAAAVWGCATSSRTRHLLTEIGAVEALLTMLQKTVAMDTAPGPGADATEQPAAAQASDRDLLQVEQCFIASSYAEPCSDVLYSACCAVLCYALLCLALPRRPALTSCSLFQHRITAIVTVTVLSASNACWSVLSTPCATLKPIKIN